MADEYQAEVTGDGKILLKKRFTFKCWQCGETYSILREVNLAQKLQVRCTECGAKADVDFRPFTKVKSVLRQDGRGSLDIDTKTILRNERDRIQLRYFSLPKVLPTKKLK